MALTAESALKLISRAWGKQSGYVFFPWIDGSAEDKGQRIRGYHEDRAFKWPADKAEIIKHLEAHTHDDMYWCPSIFEKKVRQLQHAMDEHALWADLDMVNPAEIDEEYRPTIAWESSPGRFQALWLITGGDIQGASWPGNENQKLTYYLGADHSGWDTTQLLRIPGWANHKPEYKDANDGNPVPGRLLWHNGRRYLADEFEDLPPVTGADAGNLAADVLEDQIAAVDRLAVWGRVRLKCSKEVRELVSARATGGEDRSDKLWQIERDLADAGLTVPEIVAIVRETVWNKFAGRADELKRLLTEAAKAIAERSEDTEKQLEKDREEKPRPGNLFTMVKEAEPPVWLVKGIITQASCGFFAGEPKSFKSWSALDLVLSVATGAPFLNAFDVLEPGPVLYIQEEDPLPTLKDRLAKMVPGKTQDRVTAERDEEGELRLVWEPADENNVLPRISAIVREQFTVSDPGWQAWLDEVLTEGYTSDGITEQYKMVMLDPLMMIAGDVDENRAQEMTEKIYRPLKIIAEKHQCAIIIVHHMRKGRDNDNGTRGGQKMLGSVANHAWSENSLYFTHGRLGIMLVETESKHAQSIRFEIRNLRKKSSTGQLTWEPEVNVLSEEEHAKANAGKSGNGGSTRSSRKRSTSGRVGQGTRKMVARHLGMPPDSSQGDVRSAWEAQGGTWGIFDFSGHTDDDDVIDLDDLQEAGEKKKPGRKPDPDPAALRALRKLTARKPRAYSTHEVNEEMAKELGVKTTQTTYLRAYQQLKKQWDLDNITRVEKDWVLHEVDADDLDDAEIEELV